MISQKSIQEVLDTVKIEDVIGGFITLRRRGVNMIGLCPFHNEKTPSFNVSPTKNIYKCFGCGKGGNAVQFIMEHEQLTFPEAIRYLAEKYNIELEETVTSQEAIREKQLADSLFIVNEYARKFYQTQMLETDRGKSVGLGYFKQRGFRLETIEKFGLGYAPEKRDAFVLKAVHDGHPIDLLRKVGLVSQYDNDFFRDRVMFPIHNLAGKVVAFAGRILQKDVKAPKYINSPETEIYNKSKTLYGAYFAKKAIQQLDECILVEGYTDVISLHQAGIEHVVASSGTSLTVEQIGIIKRYTPNVKILYDGDMAGIKAALRGLDMVLEQDLNVKVVLLPDGEDPDSYLEKAGAEEFRTYLKEKAQDFITFKTDLLLKDAGRDPVKRAGIVKDIVSSIGKIPDPVKRAFFIQECAQQMNVAEQILINEVNKIVTQQLKKQKQKAELAPRAQADDESRISESVSDGSLPPPPVKTEAFEVGDGFQESNIARILVNFGGELYDEEDKMLVAEYILFNVEDIINDFENKLYKKIIEEVSFLLKENLPVTPQYFIHHQDSTISQLSVNLLTYDHEYEYSENWEKKHGIFLSQKRPEKNYIKDALSSLLFLKIKKLDIYREIAKENIEEFYKIGDEKEYTYYLKARMELDRRIGELSKRTGTVVLRY